MNEIVYASREKLARMAGQIADFFRAYPEEEAAAAVADHINRFWTRRMRAEFLASAAPADPLLARAIVLVRRPESQDIEAASR